MVDFRKLLERTRLRRQVVRIYCDGGVIDDHRGVRSRSSVGGVWAYCGVDANNLRILEAGGVVKATRSRDVTNNHMKQIALCKAMEDMPCGWEGCICSDSYVALRRAFFGGSTYNLPRNIRDRSAEARMLLGHVDVVVCKGHPRREMLMSGQAWRYEVPCEKPKKAEPAFLGREQGSPWCTLYSHEEVPDATLSLARARRKVASVYHVSPHQAWCDDECKRQAKAFREVNVF
jgi:hypothetical protein